MGITVAFNDDLFNFIPFQKLPAALKAGALALARQVALHGRDGFLPWTFEELRHAAELGRKQFAALVAWIRRLWLGETEGEGAEVTGIRLTGLLVATVQRSTPLDQHDSADLQQRIDEGIAAGLSAAIEAARPGIIREYERNRKRSQSAQEVVSGKPEGSFPETAPIFPESEAQEQADFPETPLRARAFESNSNRFEEGIYIPIDSTRIDSRDPPAPETPPDKPTGLTIVDADIIQVMGRYGILETTARNLIHTHGSERCKLVLAAIPVWKPRNPAERIHAALKNRGKWPLPPQVNQQSLPLLFWQQGGAPSKAEEATAHTEPAAPARTAPPSLSEMRERLSETERQALRCDAIDRLQPASRSEYDKATSQGKPLGALVTQEIRDAEDAILRGLIRKAATG